MADSQLPLFSTATSDLDESVTGLDDMNIVEVILGLPGSRRPPQGETISVPWERGERSYYVEYNSTRLQIEWRGRGRTRGDPRDFYIEVETPESKGLPNNLADDVFVALLKMTVDDGFSGPTIRTSRYALINLMKWHVNGAYYDRLTRILSQFVHMTVSTNALWDPNRQKYFEGEFNILDSWKVEDSLEADPESPLVIRWGAEVYEIFSRNYMKQLDTELYYSLSNSTTKRIFRWLDKHLGLYPVVEIDVLRFAHKVLGYGVSYRYPSKVVDKLEPKFDTLREIGFCEWDLQSSNSDSGKKFVFTRLTSYTGVALPRRDQIVEALSERGIDHPEHIVDEYDWERCLRQISYFDWRKKHGKEISNSGAWLTNAIQENYDLPKSLRQQIEISKETTAEWCETMYNSLSNEEKKNVDEKVEELLEIEELSPSHSRRRRIQLRNHVLLSRKRKMH